MKKIIFLVILLFSIEINIRSYSLNVPVSLRRVRPGIIFEEISVPSVWGNLTSRISTSYELLYERAKLLKDRGGVIVGLEDTDGRTEYALFKINSYLNSNGEYKNLHSLQKGEGAVLLWLDRNRFEEYFLTRWDGYQYCSEENLNQPGGILPEGMDIEYTSSVGKAEFNIEDKAYSVEFDGISYLSLIVKLDRYDTLRLLRTGRFNCEMHLESLSGSFPLRVWIEVWSEGRLVSEHRLIEDLYNDLAFIADIRSNFREPNPEKLQIKFCLAPQYIGRIMSGKLLINRPIIIVPSS